MSPNIDDTQNARARLLRFEDIVTIEDASVFARDHASHIPSELLRRVWHVRGKLTGQQARELARRFAIRTNYKTKGSMVHESPEWVKYEVRRHVVAELEGLLGTDSPSAAASSNEGVSAVDPNGDAEASVPARGAALWCLEKTPRTIKDLLESLY